MKVPLILLLLSIGLATPLAQQRPGDAQPETPPPATTTGPTVERFLTCQAEPVTTYRALRNLRAANKRFKKEGWMVAWTELSADAGFRYEIVSEGGSEYIRKRVLRKMLEAERDAVKSGQPARSSISHENYQFAAEPADGEIARILIKPRRKDGLLVDGAVVVDAASGDLLRIEGRLAKNPSFWTNRVDVSRQYRRIAGIRVPVAVESTASVKIVGTSTFLMTYEYESINGRAVGQPSPPVSPASAPPPERGEGSRER